MGPKDWLFNWTEVGAKQVGVIQSLLTTCRLHDINPYQYLVDVLQRVAIHPDSYIEALMPRCWKEDDKDDKGQFNMFDTETLASANCNLPKLATGEHRSAEQRVDLVGPQVFPSASQKNARSCPKSGLSSNGSVWTFTPKQVDLVSDRAAAQRIYPLSRRARIAPKFPTRQTGSLIKSLLRLQ